MKSFEQAFASTEEAAAAALEAVTGLGRLARQLEKAAKEGNVAAIRRIQDRLDTELGIAAQAVGNATRSWRFEDDEEERFLKDGYRAELCDAASRRGLKVHERDGRLIVHPSIVHVLPGERAVRVDKRKVSTIRPSHLAGILHAAQSKKSRNRPERILEALYETYSDLARDELSGRPKQGGPGRVVLLERIYRLWTGRPGSKRDYTRTDFARDLYLLDTGGTTRTRKGATISFPASTGTRGIRGLFTFIGPDGQDVPYYGIRFTEPH